MNSSPPGTSPSSQFGANAWLVDRLYARFQADRHSVDPAWWDFFEDYQPTGANPPTRTTPSARPAARGEPAKAPPRQPHLVNLNDEPTVEVRPATASYAETEPQVLTAGELAADQTSLLRGAAARAAANMEASLRIPLATSMRIVPVKALIENRTLINEQLARERGGRVSFTHLVAFAMAEALREMPAMNVAYAQDDDGKPLLVSHEHVTLGIAIDIVKPDAARQLVVPGIKQAEKLPFAQFWAAYDALVARTRAGGLKVDDLTGITATLTNPGGLGTVASVPRLMPGQGLILGVGSLAYPADFAGASDQTITAMAVSKQMTLTSTYDHRVIQGAQSGEFLALMATKLTGDDGFYDRVFASLRIPYQPFTWQRDLPGSVEH
ncbi:MAG: 2-oxo acid dehydrogenase subunit E2, partial [Bifidobacteriaceae bacterium]|nr:2-oxo acid dehydrogenase subunit E2 [Bifidobacteriaceae bacterium]